VNCGQGGCVVECDGSDPVEECGSGVLACGGCPG